MSGIDERCKRLPGSSLRRWVADLPGGYALSLIATECGDLLIHAPSGKVIGTMHADEAAAFVAALDVNATQSGEARLP